MRVDDGGGYVAPPPPKPVKPAAPPPTPVDPGMRQGAASTTQWPGGPDAINYKGIQGPELRMLKMEQQQDAESGTFNDGSSTSSQTDTRFASAIAQTVAQKVSDGQYLSPNDTYALNSYLSGQEKTPDSGDKAQLLQNVLGALGPQASAAYLTQMSGADYKKLGIQQSFNTLVSSGKLTPADARALADSDAQNQTGENGEVGVPSTIESLAQGTGNDANSVAFKNAYAQQCLSTAGQMTDELNSGSYSSENKGQAQTERTRLYGQAAAVLDSTPNDDSAKRAAFTQMTSDANALAASDPKTADSINAYALDTLGTASPAAVVKQLDSMGGVGPNNAIAPDSTLGKFLSSAIRGQASFGALGLNTGIPNRGPNGVGPVLEALSKGGNPNLTQAVLSNVLQTFIANPDQASAIQSQDAYTSGLQKSLSDALGSSFDQYLTRDGKAGVDTGKARELAVLSGIENGPPYEKGVAANFEAMVQNKAAQFSKYGLGKTPDPYMSSLFENDPQARKGALDVSSGLMQSYLTGANAEETTLVARANGVTTPDKIGDALGKITDVSTLYAAIPGDLPGDGLAAGAATVSSVYGALKDIGIISNDPDAGKKKAEAQLEAGNERSGVDTGLGNMAKAYQSLETSAYNASVGNDPFIISGDSKPVVDGNDQTIANFFSNDDAPVVPAY